MSYNIAVVGATGNVGRVMVNLLEDRFFPVGKLFCLASKRSVGKSLRFRTDEVIVEDLENFDFSQVDIVLSSPGSTISAEFVPRAVEQGAIVIDNTSYFRFADDVPLIVPEVNAENIIEYKKSGIIANPNCNVVPISVILKPLHDKNAITRIIISTYQSVSGAGKDAMDELFDQSKGKFTNSNVPPKIFPHPIAFNVIPQVGNIEEDGHSEEEIKTEKEIHKILDIDIPISVTCVRVPTFIGHSASILVEFEDEISASEARKWLDNADGVVVLDERKTEEYITPIQTVGKEFVYASRIRNDHYKKNCLNLWISSDNLRKGAALNAIQIAEMLIEDYL